METRYPQYSSGRIVPWSAKVGCLFGGYTAAGWALLMIGLAFAYPILINTDLQGFLAQPVSERVHATVTSIEPTRFGEGRTKHRKANRIYAYHFEYQRHGIRKFGTSYLRKKIFEPPKVVTVELRGAESSDAVIEGFRRKPFGPIALLVLLFPGIGSVLVVCGTLSGLSALSLLTHGVLTTGKALRTERTNMKINKQTVYRVTMGFQAADGRMYEAQIRTCSPELLEDEREQLLYNPRNPTHARPLDMLPGGAHLEGNTIKPGAGGFWLLICPAIVALELLLLPHFFHS